MTLPIAPHHRRNNPLAGLMVCVTPVLTRHSHIANCTWARRAW
ncbi:MAG: hypothetical protein ABJN35_05115 [Erythrobacter sp.]